MPIKPLPPLKKVASLYCTMATGQKKLPWVKQSGSNTLVLFSTKAMKLKNFLIRLHPVIMKLRKSLLQQPIYPQFLADRCIKTNGTYLTETPGAPFLLKMPMLIIFIKKPAEVAAGHLLLKPC